MPKMVKYGSGRTWRRNAGRVAAKAVAGGMRYAAKQAWRRAFAPRQAAPQVESTTTQADRQNINLSRRSRGARIAIRRRKVDRALARRVNNATVNTRTYLNTHGQFSSVTQGNLDALITTRGGGTTAAGNIGRQVVFQFAVATYSQNDTNGYNDLNNLLEINGNSTTIDAAQTYNKRIYIKSYLFEVMLRNTLSVVTYVDVYFWKCKRDSNMDVQDIIAATDAEVSDDGPADNQYVNLSTDTYGWTPYQCRALMRIIDIYKKERFQLGSGGVTQLEMRSSVNKVYVKRQSIAADGTSVLNKLVKGISMGMICIAYGSPGSSPNQFITNQCSILSSANKTVFWKQFTANDNADTDRAIAAYA